MKHVSVGMKEYVLTVPNSNCGVVPLGPCGYVAMLRSSLWKRRDSSPSFPPYLYLCYVVCSTSLHCKHTLRKLSKFPTALVT